MACDNLLDIVPIHFAGDQSARLEWYRAWRNAAPRRLTDLGVILAERGEAVPRRLRRHFAAGVSQLNCAQSALASQEVGYASPGSRLSVGVNARAMISLAASLLDSRLLDEHDAGAAHREFAEMNQMPVGRRAVDRRILGHRRDHDAIASDQPAQSDRCQQQRIGPVRRAG